MERKGMKMRKRITSTKTTIEEGKERSNRFRGKKWIWEKETIAHRTTIEEGKERCNIWQGTKMRKGNTDT